MDRITVNETKCEAQRQAAEAAYPNKSDPCPGTRLELNDDVLWLGFINARVLWGHDEAASFCGYAPDIFGEDVYAVLDVGYVSDRAPADPEAEPLPIFDPQQQLAQQPDAKRGLKPRAKNPDAAEVKRVLTELLATLPPEARKKARAYIKQHRGDIDLPEG
jgi:hypothetical protein